MTELQTFCRLRKTVSKLRHTIFMKSRQEVRTQTDSSKISYQYCV